MRRASHMRPKTLVQEKENFSQGGSPKGLSMHVAPVILQSSMLSRMRLMISRTLGRLLRKVQLFLSCQISQQVSSRIDRAPCRRDGSVRAKMLWMIVLEFLRLQQSAGERAEQPCHCPIAVQTCLDSGQFQNRWCDDSRLLTQSWQK